MNEEEKVSNGGTRERQTRGLFALWRDYWFWCRGVQKGGVQSEWGTSLSGIAPLSGCISLSRVQRQTYRARGVLQYIGGLNVSVANTEAVDVL